MVTDSLYYGACGTGVCALGAGGTQAWFRIAGGPSWPGGLFDTSLPRVPAGHSEMPLPSRSTCYGVRLCGTDPAASF